MMLGRKKNKECIIATLLVLVFILEKQFYTTDLLFQPFLAGHAIRLNA
jgi:hypothetical protein